MFKHAKYTRPCKHGPAPSCSKTNATQILSMRTQDPNLSRVFLVYKSEAHFIINARLQDLRVPVGTDNASERVLHTSNDEPATEHLTTVVAFIHLVLDIPSQ